MSSDPTRTADQRETPCTAPDTEGFEDLRNLAIEIRACAEQMKPATDIDHMRKRRIFRNAEEIIRSIQHTLDAR